MADEPEILTPQEAAEFLRVPLLTVQRQAKAGKIPGRRIGKEWRFSRTVLIKWMAGGPGRHDLELYNRRVDADEENTDQQPSDEEDSA
jgi:excisionase family DNA binding protein